MTWPAEIVREAIRSSTKCSWTILVTVLAVASFWSPASAESMPPDVSALFGNTVDIEVDLESRSLPELGLKFEERHRFYFTRDGTRILSPAEPGTLERENAGITYGLSDKLCAEHKRVGYDWQFIACGSFSVTRNLVTLYLDGKGWATG